METINKFKDKIKQWANEFYELETDENIKLKHSFDFKDKTLIFNISVINRKLAWTKGISNKTKDGYFVPFFDWDNLKLSYVKEETKILQEQFPLGDLLIFRSSRNSYQGVGFSKLTLHEFQEVLMFSSCDFAYIRFPRFLPYGRYYILRQFSKGNIPRPKYLFTLKSKTVKQQSTGHHKYFKLLYPEAKIKDLKYPDNLQGMKFINYPTGTNIL